MYLSDVESVYDPGTVEIQKKHFIQTIIGYPIL